jgi:hypothetical protein
MTGFSPQRSTAVHEAGHGVMAYLLGRPFTRITVVADGDTLGSVSHKPPGDWFRPDIEINGRVRNMIEDHVMICLAGAAAEESWLAGLPDAPEGWRDTVTSGAAQDRDNAIGFADPLCSGSVPELEAYLEWQHQRVLGFTGREPDFDVTAFMPNAPQFVINRYRNGTERFWTLTEALADAIQRSGTLPWNRARAVLRNGDPMLLRLPGSRPS